MDGVDAPSVTLILADLLRLIFKRSGLLTVESVQMLKSAAAGKSTQNVTLIQKPTGGWTSGKSWICVLHSGDLQLQVTGLISVCLFWTAGKWMKVYFLLRLEAELRTDLREKWKLFYRMTWTLCLMNESDSRQNHSTDSKDRWRKKLQFHFLFSTNSNMINMITPTTPIIVLIIII